MRRGHVVLASVLLTLVVWEPASAQTPVIEEGLPLAEALEALTTTTVSPFSLRDALVVGTQLEVGTTPFGTGSSAFSFVLDPVTGVDVRTPTTFGPAFAERVLTSGKDKVSVGLNFISATYDKLGDLSLGRMDAGSIAVTGDPDKTLTGTTSLVLSSQSLVLFGSVGLTDDLDFGVAVPFVTVAFDGIGSLENGYLDAAGDGEVVRVVEATGRSSGVGDVMLSAKYRLPIRPFGDDDEADVLHDPGGLGLLVRARIPTGEENNLRGLGITRVLASLLVSGSAGNFGFHGNAGFEWWSNDIPFRTDSGGAAQSNLRHMVEYVAGVDFTPIPEMTFIFDVLGRHVRGDGGSIVETEIVSPTSTISFVGMSALDSLRKLTVAPGLKWAVKGNLLVSVNALIPVDDNGLHDEFTPVVGLAWGF